MVMKRNNQKLTCDKSIRAAFKRRIENYNVTNSEIKIIDELGILHGEARIDLAVINEGAIHGYELKSDVDTLLRLPEQMRIYNSVFSKITLVVGKKHLHEAIRIIPEWWGISVAKIVSPNETVLFYDIREADLNPDQDSVSIASLLWRDEAINILEDINKAEGVRSKAKEFIYERLAEVFDKGTLSTKVSEYICARTDWRVEIPCILNGG
jgi:hypothetical protein